MIFYMSSQVGTQSNGMSLSVSDKVITTVSLIEPDTGLTAEAINHYVRKNAHFIAYAILGTLLYIALETKWAGILIGILYAASDEIHQIFVSGRGPSIIDVGIDTAGVLIGFLICILFSYNLLKNKNKSLIILPQQEEV